MQVELRQWDTDVREQQERRSVAERREQLIEAAINVVASEGIVGTTTRRITDEAGLALGAFHYAFDSKNDLLRAVIDRFSEGIEYVLTQSVGEDTRDLRDFAERVIHGFWEFIEATPDLQLAQYELTVHALRDPDLVDLAQFQYERMARAVMLVLAHVPGVPDGQEREDLARYFAATMDGLILQHVVQRDPAAARRRLQLYITSLGAIADAYGPDVDPNPDPTRP
ncbi:MAG: TetR/AcrR family transcriptional regulator [Nitriliruptoraceae bacterium]